MVTNGKLWSGNFNCGEVWTARWLACPGKRGGRCRELRRKTKNRLLFREGDQSRLGSLPGIHSFQAREAIFHKFMNTNNLKIGALAIGCTFISTSTPGLAELPGWNEQPWLGYFIVHTGRKAQLTMTTTGELDIMPFNRAREPIGEHLKLRVTFFAQEILPDGTVKQFSIKPETLESSDPATDKLTKVTFSGPIEGKEPAEATFEGIIEHNRGEILLGGRIVGSALASSNPLRCNFSISFPHAYAQEESAMSGWDKKQGKAFERTIRKDQLDLKYTDGGQSKLECTGKLDAKSTEVNGAGIQSVVIDISAFDGNRFEFIASPASFMTLRNHESAPLNKGFSLDWTSDAVKDPTGSARLSIKVK